MVKMLCFFGIHAWVPMKWGVVADLDCRECSRCNKFQIETFGHYRTVPPINFPHRKI